MKISMNRRCFLSATAVGAAGLVILRNSRSAWSYQANEKLNIAVVGIGKRGRHHVGTVPRIGENLVALCDANRQRAASIPEARSYQDFRKMLDEMDREIDAVIIATPDHTHAVIAAEAMKRGKHVYVEKPIAHDVSEARSLRRIANQEKVATQMGNQGMATDSFRRTLELIRAGAVGEIREVHAWFVFGGSGPRKRPKDSPPVPNGFDWDLWLGPAPLRPYHPTYVSGWWAWREYGTGCLGGGGSHSMNLAFKSLDLGALWQGGKSNGTIRVEAEPSERCQENFPRWQIIRFDFPQRGVLPPVRIHWYNAPEGKLRELGIWQRLEEIAGRSLEWKDGSWTPRSGTLLVGSKGVVHTNAHNSVCQLLPASDFPDAGGPPRSLPRSGSHEREWVQACKGGRAPISNFDHSGPVIELLLLGNIATLFDQAIEFAPQPMKILGNDQADSLLHLAHREGWDV